MDTIFAQASARGKAGVAVVRLSGPGSWEAVRVLAGRLPEPRVASLCTLSEAGGRLDEALVLTFAEGASFTGEEAAELHLHGAVATVAAVLRALSGLPGLRPAEPGEFTRRALENGRLDLAQVEGLADLIEAETESQRKQALRVLSGEIGRMVGRWRGDLIRAAALCEATIDFVDEDVPVDVWPEVQGLLSGVLADLERERAGVGAAERIRDGFVVAIVGRPNVGKSTLLNALAGREAAITSEVAGTTRDVIEVRMDLGGLPVTLLDTAGLRESGDAVERIGVERAKERAEAADLRIFLVEAGEEPGMEPREGDLVVRGKADLGDAGGGLAVSGRTGEGLEVLVGVVSERLAGRAAAVGVVTRERHRVALGLAAEALRAALQNGASSVEMTAEFIRAALRSLDQLLGKVGVEDILDDLFASFCIGK